MSTISARAFILGSRPVSGVSAAVHAADIAALNTALTAEITRAQAAEVAGSIVRLTSVTGTGDEMSGTVSSAQGHIEIGLNTVLRWLQPGTNAAADPTITIGGVSYVLKQRTGAQIPAGGLLSGRRYMGTVWQVSGAPTIRVTDVLTLEDMADDLTAALTSTGAALTAEITRAQAAEDAVAADLTAEIARAQAAEDAVAADLTAEIARAQAAEDAVAADLTAEIARAQAAEDAVAADLTAEIARAQAAEALLAPKASPAFTGTPTVPTAAPGTNTTQAASTAFASTIGDRVLAISSILLQSVTGSDTITASHYPAAANVIPAQARQIYTMRLVGTNTTSAVTLSVNGGAALPVYDAHGAALAPGDLQNGAHIILACISGTSYRVISTLMTPAQVREITDDLSSRIPRNSAASSITPIATIGGDLVLSHDGDGIDFRPSPRLRSDLLGAIDKKIPNGDFSTTMPLLTAGGDILLAHDGDGIDFIPSPVLQGRLVPSPVTPSFSGRERLARLRAKIAALRQAADGERLRVLLIGDSWVRLSPTRAGIVEVMTKDHPLVGEGWLSASIAYSTITGAVYTGSSGWTSVDGTFDGMPLGYTPDGQYLWTDQADQTLSWSNITCTRFSIYVLEHGGTWRYRVDGGAWVAVEDDTGGALKRVQITGLSDAPHTFEIDTVGNIGTVAIAGYYMARDGAEGIEISRFGDGGSTALTHLGYLEAQTQVLHDEPPDLIITVLGTNDARSETSLPDTYVEYMSGLLTASRAVQPDVSAIHVIPPNNGGTVLRPTTAYRDAIHKNSDTLGSAYLSLTEYYMPYDQGVALGLWQDTFHPSYRGGRMIADLLNDLLIGI